MTDTRRPISLLASVALGLGAALLTLLAGGGSAAAAPAGAGLNPPLPAKCFARDDSNTGTIYSSADSAAVRNAVGAATTHDIVRLAGICAGVAPQGGTTQTVLINEVLTLIGGYTTTNWVTSFPLTQPTTLDAQGLGRVITASADITIGDLTVQNGDSLGGNGGAIFAGANLTALGDVKILNSTALGTALADRAGGPSHPAVLPAGEGGGAEIMGNAVNNPAATALTPAGLLLVDSNTAHGDGGGLKVYGLATLSNATLSNNTAFFNGGGLNAVGTLHLTNSKVDSNTAVNGAGLYTQGGATIDTTEGSFNTASYGGGFWAAISENQVNGSHLTISGNGAEFGGGIDFFQVLGFVYQSTFSDNRAEPTTSAVAAPDRPAQNAAGGAVAAVDSSVTLYDDYFKGNTSIEGEVFYGNRLLSPLEVVSYFLFGTAAAQTNQMAGMGAAATQPLASSTAFTGSAFSASGVSLFITDTIVAGYSLALETGTNPSSTIHGDYNLFDATPVISGTNVTTGTHSLVGNPMFADAAGHLSAGSPAIDHGVDVGINVDLDGNHRPSGGGFDIGAYEFQEALLKLFLPLVMR